MDLFCLEDEEFSQGALFEYDADEETCTMLSGDIFTLWSNTEQTLIRTSDAMPKSGEEVEKKHCCRAYQENGLINNSIELLFACEELDEIDTKYDYNSDDMVCTVDTTRFTYVDRNADDMWTLEDDGEYYDFAETTD